MHVATYYSIINYEAVSHGQPGQLSHLLPIKGSNGYCRLTSASLSQVGRASDATAGRSSDATTRWIRVGRVGSKDSAATTLQGLIPIASEHKNTSWRMLYTMKPLLHDDNIRYMTVYDISSWLSANLYLYAGLYT